MWLAVIVHPESSFSIVRVTFVVRLSGVSLAPPSWPESAIEKHAACAAAISSSGFVPGAFSNRVVNEYGVLLSTPPGAEIDPFPSFSPPFHTALALRSIAFSSIHVLDVIPSCHCRRTALRMSVDAKRSHKPWSAEWQESHR